MHAGFDQIYDQQDICYQRNNLTQRIFEPCFVYEIDTAETHSRADYSHQGTTGDETGSKQGTLFSACRIDRFVFAAGSDILVDGSTYDERQVQFQRNKHTQCEG